MKPIKIFTLLTICLISKLSFSQAVKLTTVEELEKKNVFIYKVELKNDTFKLSTQDLNEGANYHHQTYYTLGENNYSFRMSTRPGFDLSASIMTIPFKVRPRLGDKPQMVVAGLKNAGVNIGFYDFGRTSYFIDKDKVQHKGTIGVILAPGGEVVSPSNSSDSTIIESNRLFLSTGLTLTYSYNDLSISAVPIGFDFGLNPAARMYDYHATYYWGFGIGIKSSIFY